MVSQNFVLIKVLFLCDQVVFFLFDQVYSFIVGDFDSNECHFKWAIPGLFLLYFSSFQPIYWVKTLDFSWIWTRIVRIEGEHADHLTPTTAHECCFNEEHNRLSFIKKIQLSYFPECVDWICCNGLHLVIIWQQKHWKDN